MSNWRKELVPWLQGFATFIKSGAGEPPLAQPIEVLYTGPGTCRGYVFATNGKLSVAFDSKAQERKCVRILEKTCEAGFCGEHCDGLCASTCPRKAAIKKKG